MTENFELSEDIYKFLDNVPFEKDNVKELIEYVHFKALLDSFTYIIENSKEGEVDYLLPDYVVVLSKVQLIINSIKIKYENGQK
jgi:hypothetical protein